VLCNTHIKWEALLKRADMLDCEFIATGHYAQVRKENERFVISRGLDLHKDQSYVLWGLKQQSLMRTIFPLGQFKKPEIRKMAEDAGFGELAKKPESYEICFIPENDYRAFLKTKVTGLEERVDGGNFIMKNGGAVVGKHKGYPFYTIGQRKGLDIALGDAVFVTEIIPETNTVVLGTKEDLLEKHLRIRDFNLIKYAALPDDFQALTKIRYKDPGTMATINADGNKLDVIFHNAVTGIAPGQSAVMYEGEDLVGGGFIDRANVPLS
ncbi:MAG: tRNA 2-thiouridine(34) synthase MnmA, partial [Bacteroidia bacterium]|nr:tRNA 2-thiouridine(34) synthase MnmA [Bacteroidia bacterium]